MIIGIDFGTCYSSVAVMSSGLPNAEFVDKYMEMLGTKSVGIPTLFMYSRSQCKELFGKDCVSTGASVAESSEIIRYIKRTIRESQNGFDEKITSGGNTYTLGELVKKYLSYLIDITKECAVERLHLQETEIEFITITVPLGSGEQNEMWESTYNAFLRDSIVEITHLDKNHVKVIEEPIAASLSYISEANKEDLSNDKLRILVFDLGGGTLDVSVVDYDGNSSSSEKEFVVVEKGGKLRLGGNDWDAELEKYILQTNNITSFSDPSEEAEFHKRMTELKLILTESEKGSVVFTYDGDDQIAKCTRGDFESVTRSKLEQAMETMNSVVERVDGGFTSIDKIVLVGGSSNMPQIKNAIIEKFGRSLGIDKDNWESKLKIYRPESAVSRGAAILSKRLFLTKVSFEDKATHTFGFLTHDNDSRPLIFNMIFVGDKFSERKIISETDETFIPHRDEQEFVTFEVSQTECRREDCFYGYSTVIPKDHLLTITVKIPSNYRGRARSYVLSPKMVLTDDNILELFVRDIDGNQVGFGSTADIEKK